MFNRDKKVRESLNMDSNHCSQTANLSPVITSASSPVATHTTFKTRRSYTLSITTLLLLAAVFICSILAVGLIVYNFATCKQLTNEFGDDIICTKPRSRNHTPNDTQPMHFGHEVDVRLPHAIKPLKYNITLVPYLNGNFTFDGEVQIRFRVLEDCYNITMHAFDLNISKSDVFVHPYSNELNTVPPSTLAGGKPTKTINGVPGNSTESNNLELKIRKLYMLTDKQFFVIELYDKLLRDKEYMIKMKFKGHIKEYLQGFYRSSYKVQNETRWIASTQFQPTDARRAFPCFDEPALKATFTLNIARPANMTTVSNMPIIDSKKHDTLPNYTWDYFAESLPMSTYLVAYAITDFSHLSDGNFSVWARQDAIQSAKYALSCGPKVLKYLEEFFDLKFLLPKMDMIALPEFQAGAMENWGLVTYRETAMLFEKGISATTNKQRIASVVGHELAHQWFGNLVTPSWWTDIWLNEGFASYMEYLTLGAIHPEWKAMDQFVVNELQNVFTLDALSTSHKISIEVLNPDEINEIFDRISYAKGSTIIRMMSHFLTSAVFRRGLTNYLREMAYQSAEQDDLWRFLTEEATRAGLLDNNTSVKEIMDTWTLQVGFPVVSIFRNENSHIIKLEQRRFLYVNESANNTESVENKNLSEPLWWIPITFTTSKELDFVNTRPLTWIPKTQTYEIENQNLSTAEWFIFNIQQTGYYRVNYQLDNWQALIAHLMDTSDYKKISPSNRAQLIDDSLNLARAGYLQYNVALNLTKYLHHELDHVPWKAAITAFNFIDSMFANQGDYDIWKSYLLKLIEKVYNNVRLNYDPSVDDEDMLKLFKRSEILNLACHLGHQECINESIRNFQNWIQVPNPDTNNPISPNMRSFVYCTAIQFGTENDWNFAFERYLKTSVSTEKEVLLSALGCAREPWILFRYLKRSLIGEYIRKQDLFRVFAAVASNDVGQQIAFDFIRNHWQEMKVYLGSQLSNIHMILKFAAKRMNTKFMQAELEFFIKNDLKDNGRTAQQIIEQVKVNVDWMNHNYKTIVKWLEENSTN